MDLATVCKQIYELMIGNKFMIGKNRDKNFSENWEFCLFRQFLFHDNRIVQSSHYALALPIRVSILCLASRHSWMQPQGTWTSLHASVSHHSLAKITDHGILIDEIPQFLPCLFSFRRCHMHLQSYLMLAGGQILWQKAQPNHQRIAGDWFCNYQSWYNHQLACICWSNSCKQWKGEVTKCTLAGVQRSNGTFCLTFTRTQTSSQGLRERGSRGTSYPCLGRPGLKGPGRVQVSALSFGIAP